MNKPQASTRQRPLFEDLEPRILYSADAGALMRPDAFTPSAEVRILDLSNPGQGGAEQTVTATHEIVFVDTRIDNYRQLVDDLLANRDASRRIDVSLLDGTRDGIARIGEFLSRSRGIDAVHIISHGSGGSVELGSGQLNHDSLLKNASLIKQWGDALTGEADILIYGCDLAGNEEGKSLIGALSQLTGADVAASDDKTGSAALGGDWVLEYRAGIIQTQAVVSAHGQQQWNGVLANTAPVLDAGKSPALAAQNGNSGAPVGAVGTLASALVDFAAPAGQVDNVTDPDTGALTGIAITAADASNGSWRYSTDNGATWSELGAVSDASARLLAADANTRIYFQPDAGYSGAQANAITFRAWDQSSGSNGATANIEPNATVRDNFTATAYDNNDGTAAWRSGWIDIDGNANGGSYRITGGQLQIRDNNSTDWLYREADLSGAASATLTFDYTSDLNAGIGGLIYLQASNNGGASYTTIAAFSDTLNTGAGSFSADASAYATANTRVRFLTAGDSTPTKTLLIDNFQISYSTLPAGGATAFSVASDTASLLVNPVNDAPASPAPPLPLELPPSAPAPGSWPDPADSGLDKPPAAQPSPPADSRSQDNAAATSSPPDQALDAHHEEAFIETVAASPNRYRASEANGPGAAASLGIAPATGASPLTMPFDSALAAFPMPEPIDLPASGIPGLSYSRAALSDGIAPGTGVRIENAEFVEPDALSSQEIGRLIVEHKVALSSAAISAGLVSWASQYSAIFSSVLATVPAWKNLDPVAILSNDDEGEPEWDAPEEEGEENAEETAADIMSEKTGASSDRDIA